MSSIILDAACRSLDKAVWTAIGGRRLELTMRLLFLLAIGAAIGCNKDADTRDYDSLVASYDLHDALNERPLVESAIELANQMLEGHCEHRLVSAWAAPTSPRIPVHLVTSLGVGNDQLTFVPEGERAVIVVEGPVLRFLRAVSETKAQKAVLAIMLLHEVGHLNYGDAGDYASRGDIAWSALNSEDSPSKGDELRADAFAARAIQQALGVHSKSQSATYLVQALRAASVQQEQSRPPAYFGRFRTPPTEIFWDTGNSHPNFNLRLLIMLAMIQPDEESRSKLASFLDMRKRVGSAGLVLPTRGTKQLPYYELRPIPDESPSGDEAPRTTGED